MDSPNGLFHRVLRMLGSCFAPAADDEEKELLGKAINSEDEMVLNMLVERFRWLGYTVDAPLASY